MSYFGDNTPQQQLLDFAEWTQSAYSLTDEELTIALLEVVRSVIDPLDYKSKDIMRKQEVKR